MALIGDPDFTDLGWICDEAEDDAPARQSPFSPDQSSPDSSLIRRNHVAIPSTVTRLSQTCPLYPSIYIYVSLLHRFRSQRARREPLLRKPRFIRLLTFKEANATKPVSDKALAADLIETRLGKEIVFASRSPDNFL